MALRTKVGHPAASGVGNPQLTPVVVGIGHGVFDDMTVVAQYANWQPDDKSPLGLADIGSALNTLRFHDFALPVGAAHRAPALSRGMHFAFDR